MCGRVWVKTSVAELATQFSFGRADNGTLDSMAARYNGAPGLEYPLIVTESDMLGGAFISARWGLVPRWVKEPKPKVRPINAKAETVATNGMFRGSYASRRALMPIDGFFEWRATKGVKAKQPFAIAMKDGAAFALAAIWDQWRDPETGSIIKTFAVITCSANELVGQIHDRMPVIIAPDDYERWLGEETGPTDLLKPYPAEQMVMWPISRRVNSTANDDPSILDLFEDE